jgi:hypothetical protein
MQVALLKIDTNKISLVLSNLLVPPAPWSINYYVDSFYD